MDVMLNAILTKDKGDIVGDILNGQITYTIGEVAERFKVTYRTLHYYEQKIGLRIYRNKSGDREYTEEDISHFEKIFDLKAKGMSLDGIRRMFIESGFVKPETDNQVIVIDENTMELKELLLNSISEIVAQEVSKTNEKLDQIIKENEELREMLRQFERQSNEHFNKVDSQITEWRNSRPWYQKLFKKNKF